MTTSYHFITLITTINNLLKPLKNAAAVAALAALANFYPALPLTAQDEFQTGSDAAVPHGVPALEQIQTAFSSVKALQEMGGDQQYELEVGGHKETGRGDDFLRRRTGPEILASGLSSGCGDYALAFDCLMTKQGFKTLLVDSAEVTLGSLASHFSGHVVVGVRDEANQRWILADPTNHRVITNNWDVSSQTFYSGLYWIGYCGPLDQYPAHSPSALREFYVRTLQSIRADYWNQHIFKFKFQVAPSLRDSEGKLLAPHLPKLGENQDAALAQFNIHPETEINVLLVKGGDDSGGNLAYENDRGWVAAVGLQSACSLGFIDFMQRKVAGSPPEQRRATTASSAFEKTNQTTTTEPSTDFHIGLSYFPQGDRIEITSVERTSDRLVVKGRYQLVSADRAELALYTTTRSAMAVPTDPQQKRLVTKGTGDFELVHPHLVPGLNHVTLYSVPDNQTMAVVYFGNTAEAAEESKLDLGYNRNKPVPTSGPNQVLLEYLGNPVPPPADVDARCTKDGLISAIELAARTAGVTVKRVAVDDSEFPCLVGVVCGGSDFRKLKDQLGKMDGYTYGGSIGNDSNPDGQDTCNVFNLVPSQDYPAGSSLQIYHRLWLRQQVFYDQMNHH